MFKSAAQERKEYQEALDALTIEDFKHLVIKAGIYDEDLKLMPSYGGSAVTKEMRTAHFDMHGTYASDDIIHNWWRSQNDL